MPRFLMDLTNYIEAQDSVEERYSNFGKVNILMRLAVVIQPTNSFLAGITLMTLQPF